MTYLRYVDSFPCIVLSFPLDSYRKSIEFPMSLWRRGAEGAAEQDSWVFLASSRRFYRDIFTGPFQ